VLSSTASGGSRDLSKLTFSFDVEVEGAEPTKLLQRETSVVPVEVAPPRSHLPKSRPLKGACPEHSATKRGARCIARAHAGMAPRVWSISHDFCCGPWF
jgi:hypothetical protein